MNNNQVRETINYKPGNHKRPNWSSSNEHHRATSIRSGLRHYICDARGPVLFVEMKLAIATTIQVEQTTKRC